MIRYRENTGIKTPQGRGCDCFVITNIGANLLTGVAYCTVDFYEHGEDFVDGLPANASRRVEWPIVVETSIENGMASVLSFDSVKTTSEDTISLSNSIEL